MRVSKTQETMWLGFNYSLMDSSVGSAAPAGAPPASAPFFLDPETISSIRNSKIAVYLKIKQLFNYHKINGRFSKLTSTAVFRTWSLTARGSQIPRSFISAISPVSPLIPQVAPLVACFARSAVRVRMTVAPQFWAKVLGITSRAWAIARYGPWVTPAKLFAFSARA